MKEFQIFRFEEIADPQHPYAIGDGDHGAISTKCYQDFGIPYIRVGDMVDGKISLEKIMGFFFKIFNLLFRDFERSIITGIGSFPFPWLSSDGLSFSAVLLPIKIASQLERSSCTDCLEFSLVIHLDKPFDSAINPSRVNAALIII